MNLHKAIRAIHNEVKIVNGNGQEDIIAFDENGNEVNIDWTQVNAWTDPDQWKINRQLEYPTHEDCIHALLDGGDTLTDLQAKRTATKNKYPKPE
jgi:hypothetical protein